MSRAPSAALIYDWNGERGAWADRPPVELNDESLRDGLQSPSVREPPTEAKLRLLHLMAQIGVRGVAVGYPAAGPRMLAQARLLLGEIGRARLALAPNCPARAREDDIVPIIQLAEALGRPIEVGLFIGVSDVRRASDGRTLDEVLEAVERAGRFAVRAGLPVMLVGEDATRARPEALSALYAHAIRWGARRLCIADTAGHATPAGVHRLVRFVREEVIARAGAGAEIRLDWHGHRDRGLAVANGLAAAAAGVDRIHATALGVGERSGNAPLELLLANLWLAGAAECDPPALVAYCRTAAEAFGVPIPANHPLVGADAFRTGSGVHASAIAKALARGDLALADLAYASLPAAAFGLAQQIVVSPASGAANARYWLAAHGYDDADDALVRALLAAAKAAERPLTDDECAAAVGAAGAPAERP